MKDSGLPYIGVIPTQWNLFRLKAFFTPYAITNKPDARVLSLYRDYGVIPKDSRDDNHNVTSLDTSKYKYVNRGDFVINKMKAWQGSMALSGYDGIVSPAYHVFKFRSEGLWPRYAHYLLRCSSLSDLWRGLSTGLRVGQWDLHVDDFLNTYIPLPPLNEQRRIADYLDAKCTEIDAAVDSAQASIDELMTYRTAMLNQTMDAASHDARPVKLKYLLKESKDRSADGKGEPLSITIARGVLKSSELNVPNPISTLVGAKVVHAGDLVFNKLKARHGVMYVSPYDGLISSEYAIYQAFDDHVVSLRYLEYLCHTTGMIDEFIIRTSGVAEGFRRLYTTDLFDITINLPERSAQEAVVNILDTLYGAIADSIHAKQSIIDDLKAYKQSLIYEVVTGKKEV